MSELQIFEFENNQVRTVMIHSNVWFVGKDVCDVLEIKNSSDALYSLDDEDKDGVGLTDSIGRTQTMTVINESGLYNLIFKSRKPEAKQFKRWITSEVIPQIRKTGSYSVNQQPELPSYEKAVKVADSIAYIQSTLIDQPRLAQFLVDQALSTYGNAQQQLSGTNLRGVAEIAEEMNLPVSFNNRSQLGKFVKSQVGELAQQEERLCNGTMKMINCYPDCETVRQAIKTFFDFQISL